MTNCWCPHKHTRTHTLARCRLWTGCACIHKGSDWDRAPATSSTHLPNLMLGWFKEHHLCSCVVSFPMRCQSHLLTICCRGRFRWDLVREWTVPCEVWCLASSVFYFLRCQLGQHLSVGCDLAALIGNCCPIENLCVDKWPMTQAKHGQAVATTISSYFIEYRVSLARDVCRFAPVISRVADNTAELFKIGAWGDWQYRSSLKQGVFFNSVHWNSVIGCVITVSILKVIRAYYIILECYL